MRCLLPRLLSLFSFKIQKSRLASEISSKSNINNLHLVVDTSMAGATSEISLSLNSQLPLTFVCAFQAKLGAAFQFEPEAEAESNKKQLQSKLEKSHRKEHSPACIFFSKGIFWLRVSYDMLYQDFWGG